MEKMREEKKKGQECVHETLMMPTEEVEYTSSPSELLRVFVDDFVLAAQPGSAEDLLELSLVAIHAIYSVFPPLGVSRHKNGRDPVSKKKMEQGDGRWSTIKTILGFIFDCHHRTVRLPHDKLVKYLEDLDVMLTKTWIPLQEFRKVVGKYAMYRKPFPWGWACFRPLISALGGCHR